MKQTDSAQTAALPPHAQVIQMANAYIISKAIYVVAELGIPDQLRDGPRSAVELAAATEAHAPSLYRVLRTLTGLGFFIRDEDDRFSLTPLSESLQTGAPGYARSTVRTFCGPMMWNSWGEFLHSVKTGETGTGKYFGQSAFEYLGENPEQGSLFNETMIGFHGAEPPAVAAAYDFSGIGTLIDIGGGTGNLLTTILTANPELNGILFDLPHVVGEARGVIAERELSDRCRTAEGSFFEAVPEGGDAYILSHIIHDWDDEKSLQILRNCRAAMPADGRLLLVEMVIPPGDEFHPGKMLDLVMLALAGGKERTAEEYAELYEKAGFELTRIVPTESPVSVIEGKPV